MPDAETSIADRLAAARRRGFVGRRHEIALLQQALDAALPPFAVLWFHAPGGAGKSTLLARLADVAEGRGRRAVRLDARLIEPTPAAFIAAFEAAGTHLQGDAPVLLIDTCERLGPLEDWLRESFVPSLPAPSIVVCAGRRPPAWHHGVDWAPLVRVQALANLDTDESRALLAARGLPVRHHARALAYTRGHPLALALYADALAQSDAADDGLSPGGKVVQPLVERFTRDVPGPRHREALRLATLARHTTQAMLRALLGADDDAALFDWLRGLGFMQPTPHGLAMHELVRDVLSADAHWRNADATERLSRGLRGHLQDCIARADDVQRVHWQAEALYARRHAPHLQRFMDWSALDAHRVEPPRDEDVALIEAIVRRHEGEPALRWTRHWWRRQRDAFRLFRATDGGACDGFCAMLRLRAPLPGEDRADPAVAAAFAFVAAQRPLAAGEELVLLRHWMHADRYQDVTPAINLTAMHVVTHLTTHPDAAWSVVYMADPAFWQPHFDGVHFVRCPAADFTAGGRRFGAFVHDWRAEPAQAWIAGEHRAMPFAAATPAAFDEAGFGEAVRQALRDCHDVQALQRSALGDWLGLPADAGRGVALRERLCEAIERLAAHPRDRKFHDALKLTYLEPHFKQDQVAAELALPFNTYRYRLQQGTARVARMLRQATRGPL
jgi:hypothetical protein